MHLCVILWCGLFVASSTAQDTLFCQHSYPAQNSPYLRYCCNIENYGRAFKVYRGGNFYIIVCPAARPQPCAPLMSCSDILNNGGAASGYYNITLANGSTASVYCNMEGCGGEGGWTRVAYLNMSDPSQQCPTELSPYDVDGVRACGRWASSVGNCDSITFSTDGISYSQVCGRVVGYQYRSPDAIDSIYGSGPASHNIDDAYVDGVSITHGSPRQHIWAFMAGVSQSTTSGSSCPCNAGSTVSVQSFIGDDYFCESGNPLTDWYYMLYTDDPLWDVEAWRVLVARIHGSIKFLTQTPLTILS